MVLSDVTLPTQQMAPNMPHITNPVSDRDHISPSLKFARTSIQGQALLFQSMMRRHDFADICRKVLPFRRQGTKDDAYYALKLE